ncbi:MAG: glycosyltransferase family 2 protein [Candidatus Omnitrophota bacterium]
MMKTECDIILLSYESPELLKKCVRSVIENTKVRSRLIIVDNGSRDPEVRKFLNSVSGKGVVSIEKIFSAENAGFAGGMNKGIRLSDAPFICLLNNDCEVADGWLEEMISIAGSDVKVGIVNPQSNTFGSWPDEGASLNEHAFLIRHKKGKYVELGHAVAFACLIKRSVIDAVGLLDEGYKGVCYEDTDFSARAKNAGFIPVMAEGAYVFHLEQASRKNLKGKEEIYRRNKERFERQWGRLLRVFFFDSACVRKEDICRYYEYLKETARERAIVELWFAENGAGAEKNAEFFCKYSIKHADVGIRIVPDLFMAFRILWRVLTKKKKYDAVILRKSISAWFLSAIKPLHKAEVFYLRDNMEIITDGGLKFSLRSPAGFVEFLRKR